MVLKVSKKYMILKWFAAAILFSALMLGAITWYLSIKLKPILTAEIQELVVKSTDSLYHIEFSSISTNVLTGISALEDVKISPDTNIYHKLINLKRAPNNLYKIKLKKLAVRNFHAYRMWRHKKLNIDLLLFDNPCVVMTNRQFDFNEDKLPQPKKSPYDYISKYLKELRIQTVEFKNASFKYVDNNAARPVIDSVANLNVTLKDWLIDAHSATDKSRLYLLKDVLINLNNYNFATPDSLYYLNLNYLDFSASSGKLNIKSFNLSPRYEEMKFADTAGNAKERYSIQMSNINLTGIDLPLYILKQELFAKEMNIANGTLSVLSNNAFPKKLTVKTGQDPHQLLQKLNGQLCIEKLNLSNVDISYAEFNPNSGHKGVITFEQTSGTVTNVTNVEKTKAKNPLMVADLTSYLMGSGKLEVNFKFNLNAADGAFSYSGVLSNMDGRTLNRMTKPLGMVRVNSGDIKKLEFNIDANDEQAKGKVRFAYNDLSVALLKRVKGEDRLVKQGLMSFLANALIMNSDNPNAAGVFVSAPVSYTRVKTASFFNFIWKTLFQGVKYSVGLTPEKEKKVKDQIAKFGKMKMDREERIKRRAARLKGNK
ncbi:hypothetical protein [Pedobacter heparinus]|uniref:AsmA-like C-terminal domain-containing protein n=1 Tax=Pedobacter heparinus (strain ATCC 13125 / DSM 2366 / CIP 104194 / JCM 7457 / NBRC 12017 / NCIMB 9290 / NRRL B-14731 / HIM 762-3) TaxID=485917 RepID=C6XZ02_PEDHD|nr:hypothetical protein [Pedobacter heparinus]ACU02484.1 hypothetical protein Phep_0258 [Pedobacter heparinus DSM 2366]